MPSSNAGRSDQTRTYDRTSSVVFLKTDAPFGGLSNMAGGFPLRVNGIRIRTSEALYQACRFPHRPEVQALIIEQTSPMTAKMKGKPYRHDSRPDWDHVRVKIMRWCLRVKLAQNWRVFSTLLLETGDRPIVEESRKDPFWGAMVTVNGTLVGMNVLGRLLMELREAVKAEERESLMHVKPLDIPGFLLAGRPIEIVAAHVHERDFELGKAAVTRDRSDADSPALRQPSLFGESVAKEAPRATHLAIDANGIHVGDLKSYAEHKPSGLPWLGQVPAHWGLVPNRGLVRRKKVLVGRRHGDYRLLSLTKQGVIVRDVSTGKGKFSSDMGTSQEVRSGDFVFCLFDVPETPRTVGLSRHDGMITGAYTVFTTLGRGSPEYFELFYRAMDDRKLLSPLYSGLRNTIPPDRFLGTKTPQPPPEEQAAIVRFLDWANGRLDRAIRAKRKVIALLNEQKQAIIHRAVTRGLDPDVPVKPSGIPWLGDIPQHWEMLRSKYLFREVDERSVSGQETHLSMSQKLGLVPNTSIEVRRLVSDSYAGAKLCQPMDLVLNRLKAHLGVFALASQPGLVSPDYTVLRPVREMCPAFFEALYRSPGCRRELFVRAKGIVQGFWRLYTDDFYNIVMPVPPVDEQRSIMARLGVDLGQLNIAISRLESEIELLREYRTRLVADVVTGKLDVREAAARVPDEVVPEAAAEDDGEIEGEIDGEAEDVAA